MQIDRDAIRAEEGKRLETIISLMEATHAEGHRLGRAEMLAEVCEWLRIDQYSGELSLTGISLADALQAKFGRTRDAL